MLRHHLNSLRVSLVHSAAPALFASSGSRQLAASANATLESGVPGTSAQAASSGSNSSSWKSASLALLGGAAWAFSASPALADASTPAPAAQTTDAYERPTVLRGLPKEIVLYQYEVCPYCCKVKAFLDYAKLPYKSVEVNPLTKGELKWSSYKKVPIVKLDGEVVKESTAIISRLAAEVEALKAPASVPSTPAPKPANSGWLSRSSSPASSSSASPSPASSPAKLPFSVEEEAKWRKWVDDTFVKVLTANIYRNWDESWSTFNYITEQSGWGWGTRQIARSTGAVLMWQVGKGMPKKYGIEGDLRQALYNCCDDFVNALGSRSFMGGAEPNLADLAVFGVLRAVHRTPAFNDTMQHSKIAPWYQRMVEKVGPSQEVK